MITDEKRPLMYRMPTFFGAGSSPRCSDQGFAFDWSAFEFTSLSMVVRVPNEKALKALLPPGFSLSGGALAFVSFGFLKNIPWLAGRGYNTFGVQIPVRFAGKVARLGGLTLVLWENMPEPIMTGREDLGFSKIFCDISALERDGEAARCEASWDGFQFARADLSHIRQRPEGAIDRISPLTGGNSIHRKYIPKTRLWGSADIDEITLTPAPRGGRVVSEEVADAVLEWSRPTWSQMPTQHLIINQLADVIGNDVESCTITSSVGAVFDCYDQEVVG